MSDKDNKSIHRRSLHLRSGKVIRSYSEPDINSKIDKIFAKISFRDDDRLKSSESESSNINESDSESNSGSSSSNKTFIMANLSVKQISKSIPEYDGNNSKTDLHKFLMCADLVFNTLTDPEKLLFPEILKIRLSGEAYQHVKYQTFANFNAFKQSLNFQFGVKKSMAQINLEFSKMFQKKDEDVRSYASRVQKLLHELNDASVAEEGANAAQILASTNSKLAKMSFQEGLHEPIKNIIKACRFENLQDAITHACEEERIHILKNSTRTNNSSTSSSVKCQICGKLNHTAKTCYQLNSSSNPKSITTINVFCKYCKKKGHSIAECRKLKYKQSQSQASQEPITTQSQSSSQNVPKAQNSSKNVNGPEMPSAAIRVHDLK